MEQRKKKVFMGGKDMKRNWKTWGGGGRLQRKIEDKGALKALQPCQQGGRNRPTMRFEE